MSASRRVIALALALALTVLVIACEDPFTTGVPAVFPGVAVPAVSEACSGSFSCAAWSADSKTLYVVARLGVPGAQSPVSLVAVDAETRTSRIVGTIDQSAGILVASADGAAIYFQLSDSAPPGKWTVTRMSLSDGTTRTVAKAEEPEFLLSPDGTALAYHALRGQSGGDTIVLLDLPSSTRRATTVSGFLELEAFSGDGTRLAMFNGRSILVWHVTAGAIDTLGIGRTTGGLFSVAWTDTIRLLFGNVGGKTFTDTSLGGGSALTYTVGQNRTRIQWLPDRSAMITAQVSMICNADDCETRRFDFLYSTATKTTTFGNATGVYPAVFGASPDGHWLAHAEIGAGGPLYLLKQPTP